MTWTIPVPNRAVYEVDPIDPCIRSDMETGAPRTRRRTSARLDKVTVQWVFNSADMNAFRIWFDGDIDGGAAWFNLSLNVGHGLETREAKFSGIWKASNPSGMWIVSASLDVRGEPVTSLPSIDFGDLGQVTNIVDFGGLV